MRKISLNWDINVFRTKYKAFGGEKDVGNGLEFTCINQSNIKLHAYSLNNKRLQTLSMVKQCL